MDRTEIRAILAELGLEQKAAAGLLAVSVRTISGWCCGAEIDRTAAKVLRLLRRRPELVAEFRD